VINTEIYLSKLWLINKVRATFWLLEESLSLFGMFQPTELNLHRLMWYKLGHSTYTQTEKQKHTVNTNTYTNIKKGIKTHTHTLKQHVFVPSDSPLKVSVVRLCSRSALSTLVCPQTTNTHTHTHTRHTHAHLQKAGRVNCDAITSFSKIVSCFFSDRVFSDMMSMMEMSERVWHSWGQREWYSPHTLTLHPVKPRGCQGYTDACELQYAPF